MRRVIAYVDGMNLYHGLRHKYGRRYHWLDVDLLARSFLLPDQNLTQVLFCTARIRNQPLSELREEAYLAAIQANSPRLQVVEGQFQERTERCQACGSVRTIYDEKETDVNIATALVGGAALDVYDTALLITADSDLAPAIRAARSFAPTKHFVALFPPRRRSDVLRRICDATLIIGDDKVRAAQLPDRVRLASGVVVERPPYWR